MILLYLWRILCLFFVPKQKSSTSLLFDCLSERQDTFIQCALLELLQDIKFIDEFVYFYEQYGGKKDLDFIFNTQMSARSLPPYNQLKSLNDLATRNYNLTVPEKIKKDLEKYTQIIQKKNKAAKEQIIKLVDKEIVDSIKSH